MMTGYYERLSKGEGRVTAMHKAMKELRKSKEHPYYWAPFIVSGDDRTLDDKPATWVLNDIAAALLDAFADGQGSLAERVQAVTKARDVAIDEHFLERLSAMLADFLERGVLLGSAGPAPADATGA